MLTRAHFQSYDIQDTSYRYAKFSQHWTAAPKLVTTVASSTTVSSLDATANTKALAPLDVSDELAVYRGDVATDQRFVVTNSNDDTITVGTAVNWQNSDNGRAYHYRKFLSGTTASDGWVTKDPFSNVTIQVIVTTKGSTSIEAIVEGRMLGQSTTFTELWTKSYSAVGSDIVLIPENVEEFRVGFKRTGAGTNAVSAYSHFPSDRF